MFDGGVCVSEIGGETRDADGEDALFSEEADRGAVFFREDFVGGEEEGEAASGGEAVGGGGDEVEEMGEDFGDACKAEDECFGDPEGRSYGVLCKWCGWV